MADAGDDPVVPSCTVVGRDDAERLFPDGRLTDRPWRHGRSGHAGVCRPDMGATIGTCPAGGVVVCVRTSLRGLVILVLSWRDVGCAGMDRERADLIGGDDRSVRRMIVFIEEKLYGAEVR